MPGLIVSLRCPECDRHRNNAPLGGVYPGVQLGQTDYDPNGTYTCGVCASEIPAPHHYQEEETKPVKKVSLAEHPLIKRVMSKMRITKVVATRSVKGRGGDHYVGFSAAFIGTQDDAGGASTLIATMDEADLGAVVAGLTPKEAKVAAIILGMQADRAAHQNAWAGGNITQQQRAEALESINQSYGRLMLDAIGEPETPSSGPKPSEG